MIDRLDRMIQGFRDFAEASDRIVLDCVRENEAVIVDMNAEDQLYEKGENRLGVSISDYQPYSPVTVEYKRMKGQPFDRVTLRDEGDFEASFFIRYTSDSFEIWASDSKTEKLVRKYGDEILGLNDENLNEIIWEYLYPYLLNFINGIIDGTYTTV